MELFPAQPDLSLQISPPNTKPSPSWRKTTQENMDLGSWKRALASSNSTTNNTNTNTNTNPNHNPLYQHYYQEKQDEDHIGFLKPIRGVPIYQNNPSSNSSLLPLPFQFPHHHQQKQPNYCSDNSSIITTQMPQGFEPSSRGFIRPRFLSRCMGKRTIRAPRMRWTTTLHARFVRAVELLGGHERATPKSVLELMDVKDLTLAHVKSHLQMYRTVKTTDRAAASSGQSDLCENGSSGDTYEELIFDTRNPKRCNELSSPIRSNNVDQNKDFQGMWSNSSSKEAWLHGKHMDCGIYFAPFLQKDVNQKCFCYETILEVSASSLAKKPNLEFTLGRPQ